MFTDQICLQCDRLFSVMYNQILYSYTQIFIYTILIYININCWNVPWNVCFSPWIILTQQTLRQIYLLNTPFPHIQHVVGLGEMSAKSKNTPKELNSHLKEPLYHWVKTERNDSFHLQGQGARIQCIFIIVFRCVPQF